MKKNRKIVIYQTKDGDISLNVELWRDSIWLTQAQIAELFGTQRPAITKHLNNIFKLGELKKKAVSSILEHTAYDGKSYKTQFYSLDAVISVGYRVNSKRATQFRIWATKVLRQHILQGYTVNTNRLVEVEGRLSELKQTIDFLDKKIATNSLKGQEKEILDLLLSYSKTITLLGEYDSGKIAQPKGRKTKFQLRYEDSVRVINELKKELLAKKMAGGLFGNELDCRCEGIINNLYLTFDRKELYNSIEEKAANLIYMIIKDHPFSDGNKRIASYLFVYFLDRNDYLYKDSGERKINDNALVALALMVAESDPKDKDILIRIVCNLVTGN